MKQFLPILIFVCFPAFALLTAQIPNGGFESWSEFDLWEEPDTFVSSNSQAALTSGFPNVLKVDGVNGHAAHLESVGSGLGSTPGLIGLLNPEDGLSGGVPYTSTPDSVAAWFRYNIMPQDSAIFVMAFQRDGFPLTVLLQDFKGQQDEFVRMAFDVPDLPLAPDTVLFALFSSDPDNPVIGSFIEIDELTMVGVQEQLPNNGFENWTPLTFQEPDGWASVNLFNTFVGGDASASRSTDAFTGDFALRLEAVEILDLFGNITDTVGVVITSSGSVEEEFAGFPYSEMPDVLRGAYKYQPSGQDTAGMLLQFSRWNDMMQEREFLLDTVVLLPPADDYTTFEVLFNLAEEPDTATIGFSATNPDTIATPGLGSVLWVDNLMFDLIGSVSSPAIYGSVKVMPNPVTDELNLELPHDITLQSPVLLTVFDNKGVLVLSQKVLPVNGQISSVAVHTLPPGAYSLAVKIKKQLYTTRFVKQ